MHPDLISQLARHDIAERIRNVERERRARLASSDRSSGRLERLDESLRRALTRYQASRLERFTTPKGDPGVHRPRP